MTKIVRERPEVEDDEDIVRFQVYMSTKDKSTVLGVREHAYQSGAAEVTHDLLPYGVPVEQSFEEAKSYAEQKGVPYLWIDDPDDLFDENGE